MTRSLISLALASALALTLGACGGAQKSATPAAGPAAAKLPATAVCPVTKESFKPTAATKTVVHKGKTYYMCCPGCAKKFTAAPDKYLAAAPVAAADKKPCKGDCTDECGDCANPNKVAAKVEIKKASTLASLPAKVTCSVSGKEFAPKPDTQIASYQGKTHYFCCPGCASKFASDPEKFAK